MNIKKWFNRVSAFLNRYINGTKGAISLFLAFLLTPLLSLSLLLVESARYQSVVQLVEEISDMCGLSTLSNYDSYLQERFGLLSVDQEQEIQDIFKSYLKENTTMLGSAITLKDGVTSSGAYALSNDAVLRQQLLEQSEITVTAKTVFEGLDLDNLFDTLADKLNLDFMKNIGKQADYLKATAELGEALVKVVDQVQNVKKSKDAFDTAFQEYRKAWSGTDKNGNPTGFQPKALAFIEALKTATAALAEDADPDDVYDDDAVKEALKALKDATKTYKSKAEGVKSAITTLRSDIIALESTIATLDEKQQSFKSTESSAMDEKTFDASSGDWIYAIIRDALERFEKIGLGKLSTQLQTAVDKLDVQIVKLKNLDSGDYKAIKTTWTADTLNQEDYDPISVDVSILGGLWSLLNDLVKESTFDLDIMDKLNELVQLLLNIDVAYDHALNAVLSSNSIFQTTDPDSSDQAMIDSIQAMASAAQTAKDILKGKKPLYKLVSAVGKVMKSAGDFLNSIVLWATTFIADLIDVVATLFTEKTYERVLVSGYCAYNLPNRVNCTTGTALTGYKYLNVFLENGGELGAYNTGSAGGSLFDSLSSGSGNSPAFKGAVQEYILVGSMSEYENQCCAFFRVYMFRFLLNLPAVISNADWNVCGPLTIVAKILVALAEPMLDTIFLVNGMSESLWKDGLYISLGGLDNLISKVTQLVHGKVTAGLLKNEMKKAEEDDKKAENSSGGNSDTGNTGTGGTDTGNTGNTGGTDTGNTGNTGGADTGNTGNTGGADTGKEPEKGQMKNTLFSCNYGDHLYLLSVIAYNQSVYLNRLQNVIQSEANHYYTKEKGYSFDLDNAYTHICNQVEYTLNPIFSIDALTENGLFDVSFSRYNGY